MVGLLGPLWVAFLIGLVLGWSWKPKWVTRKSDKLTCCVSKILDSSLPSSPCRSLMSPLKTFGSFSQWNSFMLRSSTCDASWVVGNNSNNLVHQNLSHVPSIEYEDCSLKQLFRFKLPEYWAISLSLEELVCKLESEPTIVESRKGDGQLTSCEVLLFHHEDMGIPWEIAKLGVRHGMWGTVKKIESGLHAYQRIRASGVTLSRPAFMAQINTKINPELMKSLGDDEDLSKTEALTAHEKSLGRNIPKLLIVGGAIALACGFDRGLLTKAFIFSVGRRFGNMGKNAKLNAGST
ncbi:hypothetical protein D5086_027716 [Populus alba]|uniref:Uncharacterized protein n=1 Tax=Populus alba TaxID=43335 RepID=A0ACC4AW84_POPAL